MLVSGYTGTDSSESNKNVFHSNDVYDIVRDVAKDLVEVCN